MREQLSTQPNPAEINGIEILSPENVASNFKEIRQEMIRSRDWAHTHQQIESLLGNIQLLEKSDTNTIEQLLKSIGSFITQLQEFTESRREYVGAWVALGEYLTESSHNIRMLLNLKNVEACGPAIKKIYQTALKKYPILETVEIVNKTPEEDKILLHTGGHFALPSFGSRVGVVINPNNSDYLTLLESRKNSINIVGRLLETPAESIGVELLKTFIFGHELGHAYDYLLNFAVKYPVEDARDQYQNRFDIELNSLPIPNTDPVQLLHLYNTGELVSIVRQDQILREKYLLKDGSLDFPQLQKDQETAYRSLPKEKFADEFASELIKLQFNSPETTN